MACCSNNTRHGSALDDSVFVDGWVQVGFQVGFGASVPAWDPFLCDASKPWEANWGIFGILDLQSWCKTIEW